MINSIKNIIFNKIIESIIRTKNLNNIVNIDRIIYNNNYIFIINFFNRIKFIINKDFRNIGINAIN